MQSLQDIPDVTTLTASRAMLLSNILTALSNSSGTAFPTVNLQVGMLCHRTDQSKIYSLKDATPTWVMLIDLAALPIPNLSTLAGAANLNSVITSGFYRCGTMTNGPTGLSNGQLIVMHGGGDTISQIYCDHATGNIHVRAGNPTDVGGAGTWSAWSKQWSETNDGAASGLDADLLDGFQSSQAATANAVAVRDADGKLPGDILGRAFVATSADTAATIANGAVSSAAKIADSIITLAKHANMATGKLVGRSTAGAGIPEEIAVGAGLQLAAGTLTCTLDTRTGYGTLIDTVSGTRDVVVPAKCTRAIVLVVGGGGGGGGCGGAGSFNAGNGGGGGVAMKTITELVPGSSISYTVGAAGSAGVVNGGAGGAGGSSSFGAYVTATGGGGGGGQNGAQGAGGAGTGDFAKTGGSGVAGTAGGAAAMFKSHISTDIYGSIGGAFASINVYSGSYNGASGTGVGGGGGGAQSVNWGATGGAGSSGLVMVIWS